MRVTPRAEDLYPDPHQVNRAQVREWLEHPVTQLLLARWKRRAHPSFPTDDTRLLTEARIAQGVNIALEEIQRVFDSAKQED
jgi:hypothetical protein